MMSAFWLCGTLKGSVFFFPGSSRPPRIPSDYFSFALFYRLVLPLFFTVVLV